MRFACLLASVLVLLVFGAASVSCGDDDDSGNDAGAPADDDADATDDDSAPVDDDAVDDDAADDDSIAADLIVDVRQIDGQLNRRLNGGHYHDERPTEEELALDPKFRRRVASSANHMHWDCDTQSFSPETLAEYHDWLDLLQEDGIEPMIALSYVPECMTPFGYPKAPPLPSQAAAYDTFIRSFFHEFVSGRIAAGKAPLRYFEVWNEPDPQMPQSTGNGNGFFGSLEVFEQRVFIPLGEAVMAEEAASGVDIKLGLAACAIPRPLVDEYPRLEDFLLVAGFDPDWAAFFGPLGEALADLFYPWGGFAGLWESGGFNWPDRLVATAEREGIDVDFVSWHHYIDFPFEGPGKGCAVPDIVWFIHQRNPTGNVYEYYRDALDYRERYPGKELYLTEWGISYGCQDRPEYEIGAFHAATLIALQQAGMDGAMALYLPGEGPEAMAHWMFVHLADNLVRQRLNEDSAATGVWALAAREGDGPQRLTVLAAQWHSLLADAARRNLDVAVVGLPAGNYQVAAHFIDREHDGSAAPDETYELTAEADLPARLSVPLHGIAATFLEIDRR
jgi:hypothetical protein